MDGPFLTLGPWGPRILKLRNQKDSLDPNCDSVSNLCTSDPELAVSVAEDTDGPSEASEEQTKLPQDEERLSDVLVADQQKQYKVLLKVDKTVEKMLIKLKYFKNPDDDQKRVSFYETKKHYRHVIRLKKSRYYSELNSDIQQNSKINWECMKKLKMAKKDPEQLDLHDLSNFYEFFKKLYDVPSTHTNNSENTSSVADCLQNEHLIPEIQNDLNTPITIEEVDSAIRTLCKGRAAGEDCISNEFLLYSNTQLRLAVLNLFNQCLDNGIYPWNTSIVTPLHKKGDRYNPDNYRAIAVSSAIGKLFSSVLLKRLVSYRLLCCPDPPNQLGFCKEAQTVDHIFTLDTCISKYIKQGTSNVLELFKIFLLDLSHELNNAIGNTMQTPELNNPSLSHLLWADDLVLMALDRTSLQHLNNVVHHFCTRWCLEVNIDKTAILVFNKSGRLIKESFGLKYGDLNIPTDKTYCYLGITVTLSGSLTKTMEVLRMNGLRAYFALKSLVDIKKLKTSSLLKLLRQSCLDAQNDVCEGSPLQQVAD
ncbi:hypothetical protein ACHWQZ_G010815 [Mnemiopsis leidyi]